MDPKELESLAQRAASDLDALQRLMIHYHPKLRDRVAAEMKPDVQAFVDAEDVLQEAYAAAFQKIGATAFADAQHFFRWLETVALHDLRDIERRLLTQKRDIHREVRSIGDADRLEFIVAALGDVPPSSQADRDEMIGAVLASLSRLTAEQRTALRLRYLEQLPAADVAARLGKTEQAVHALCYRGLQELRAHFRRTQS